MAVFPVFSISVVCVPQGEAVGAQSDYLIHVLLALFPPHNMRHLPRLPYLPYLCSVRARGGSGGTGPRGALPAREAELLSTIANLKTALERATASFTPTTKYMAVSKK